LAFLSKKREFPSDFNQSLQESINPDRPDQQEARQTAGFLIEMYLSGKSAKK
jgi:hypothetical protein